MRLYFLLALPLAALAQDPVPPPHVPPGHAAALFPPPGGETPAELAPIYPTSYAPLLEKVTPAVVSVFPALQFEAGVGDPLDRFFGRDEEGGEPGQRIQGVGSGVVISDDGWIITNSHVVHLTSGKLADAISIEFPNRRRRPATIVGVDPATDLALLKVDSGTSTHLPFADSDLVCPGDLVFAIGNPFRVGTTATMGMVSAVSRSNLGINGSAGFESFIQTDAAINPGNSGGALIDAHGRLIGINTAIWSGGGGNVGIGFAIPSRLVRHVAICLAEEGKVRRGFFGWSLDEVTEDAADQAGLQTVSGALVAEVMPGGPAALAGLQAGDIIVKAYERPIKNVGDLRCEVSMVKPGVELSVSYSRDGTGARALLTGLEGPAIANDTSFEIRALPGLRFRQDSETVRVDAVEEKASTTGLTVGMEITAVNDNAIVSRATLEAALRRGINKIATRLNRAERTLAVRVD